MIHDFVFGRRMYHIEVICDGAEVGVVVVQYSCT